MAISVLDALALEYENTNSEYLQDANYSEDRYARNKIQETLTNLDITEVKVVHNNYLRGMYEIKKMEYMSRYGSVREETLFHATSASNVSSIIKDNLDWRRVTRSKYGQGVSFSGDADYANYHSNSSNGSRRALIIASVLISSSASGSSLMKIPPYNCDTSISSNGKVYVKYSDNEFLLKYIVYYNAPDRSESKHYRPFNRRRHHFLYL